MNNYKIAKRIKQARLKRSMSQKVAAGQLGIALSTYSGWEAGGVWLNLEKLNAAAELYNVSVDWLLGDEKIPEVAQ